MYKKTLEQIESAQKGDRKKLQELIEENNGLIWSIVKRFKMRGYELDDLYQIGCIGFIKSIKRFDKSFNVELSTYSVPYIIGEIKRFIRDDGPIKISRSIKELSVRIAEIQKLYLRQGKEITICEIANELKVSKEEVAVALESKNKIESLDMSFNSDSDKELKLSDKISTSKNEQEQVVNKILIQQLIQDLPNKDKQIIILRYYKEKTQSEIARILGINQVQVSRCEKKILKQMREKLNA